MTEILTESFCERCGTRYTFESARGRARLSGVKVLSRGLKNFVLSDGTSMDEAMAAARSDSEREASSQQLEAFHKTFNFCMSCRQYTCPTCWNESEARCLTCAPHLGREVMPAPFPNLASADVHLAEPMHPAMAGSNGSIATNQLDHDYPDLDLVSPTEVKGPRHADADTSDEVEIDAAARLDALTLDRSAPEVLTAPDPAVAEVEAVAQEAEREVAAVADVEAAESDIAAVADIEATPAVAEPGIAAEPEVETVAEAAEPDVAAVAEVEAAETEVAAVAEALDSDIDPGAPGSTGTRTEVQTGNLLRRFRAFQSLDAEIDAYERQQTDIDADPEALAASEVVDEPDVAAELSEPEVVAEPEPEVVVQPEPRSEPVTADAAPKPDATPPAGDIVQQPTWRRIAPDPNEGPTPGPTPDARPVISASGVDANPNAEPQWPPRPEWLGNTPAAGLPFLGRPNTPEGGLEAIWAESNRVVAAAPPVPGRPAATAGVQPCISCGLSLSATARFCRRCGTHQTG